MLLSHIELYFIYGMIQTRSQGKTNKPGKESELVQTPTTCENNYTKQISFPSN